MMAFLEKEIRDAGVSKWGPRSSYKENVLCLVFISYHKRQEQEYEKKIQSPQFCLC